MLTIAVRGLPRSAKESDVSEMFSKHGRVHRLKVAKDLFSGECKGFAELDMEGHEARAAIAALIRDETGKVSWDSKAEAQLLASKVDITLDAGPEGALRRVRTIEPRYVQTGAQERFIHHFAHYVRERAAPS